MQEGEEKDVENVIDVTKGYDEEGEVGRRGW